jgi:hypothetical protein
MLTLWAMDSKESGTVAVSVATAKGHWAGLNKTDTIARQRAVALNHTTRQAIQSPT